LKFSIVTTIGLCASIPMYSMFSCHRSRTIARSCLWVIGGQGGHDRSSLKTFG
jgi:hypothetical protein